MSVPAFLPNSEGVDAPRSLVVLSRLECLRRLESESVGRVGVAIGALPAVLPVNFAMLDGNVVFRTAPGTKLSAALLGAVVAFEVDGLDPATRTGWSVMVLGVCSEITADEDLVRAGELDLDPWAPMGMDHFVRIHATEISGRAIVAGPSTNDH